MDSMDAGDVPAPPPEPPQAQFVKLWALLVLSSTYVHQASTGYSIPIMLPMISTSLELSDLQVPAPPACHLCPARATPHSSCPCAAQLPVA